MRANCLCELVLLVSALACGVRSAPLIDAVNANITGQLFEGDIAGFDRSLLEGNEKTLGIIPNDYTQLWEDGIVYYMINEDDYDDQEQIDNILAGMRMIEDETRVDDQDCITFVERESEDNYLNIFSGTGCYSQVGRKAEAGSQDVSLLAGGCTWPGVAAHEFLHALGFWHEQSRPDRDNYITIQWNNIDEKKRYNFDKYTTNIDTLGLPYDYESIMHYSAYAFALDDSKPTIVANKPGIKIEGHDMLSKLDIQAVQKLYGCI